jgi:serine/threonine protein kinase
LSACASCRALVHDPSGTAETRPQRSTDPIPLTVPGGFDSLQAEHLDTGSFVHPRARPVRVNPAPKQLGQYKLFERLGRGGVGVVYRARHQRLKKWVAIKLLPPERISNARTVARFQREMEIVGQLQHANIVAATDAGDEGGFHYLVMELVEGLNLGQLVRRAGTLPVPEACELIRQAALGLQHAHEQGLVHRDIKPSNLMVSSRGEVKVLDLGLALLRGEEPADPLTAVGQMMGTADYMAPEQWEASHEVDIRADIYSLGCTLYTLLTGGPPFPAPEYLSYARKMTAHTRIPARPVVDLRPDVPFAVADLVGRMLAKDPELRPQTPDQLARELASLASSANLERLYVSLPPPVRRPDDSSDSSLNESIADDSTRDSAALLAPAPPARNLLRWLVGAVILAGVALLVTASGALLSKAATTRDRTYPVGAVVHLLDRSPDELVWHNPSGQSQKSLDKAAQVLTVYSRSPVLLTLGTIDAKRYRFRVGLVQDLPWPGRCGVFFGVRPTDKPGQFRCQILQIEANPPPQQGYRVSRCVGFFEPRRSGEPIHSIRTIIGHPIPAPEAGENVLQVSIGEGGLNEVRFDTKISTTCSSLTGAAIEARAGFTPADYQGEFGVFANHSGVTFVNATLKRLE